MNIQTIKAMFNKIRFTLIVFLICLYSCVRYGFTSEAPDAAITSDHSQFDVISTLDRAFLRDNIPKDSCLQVFDNNSIDLSNTRLCEYLSDALVCWDFDDPLNRLPQIYTQENTLLNVDLSLAAGGSASLSVTTQPTGDNGAYDSYTINTPTLSPPITDGEIYIRAKFFFPSSTIINAWAVLLEIRKRGTPVNSKINFGMQTKDFFDLSVLGQEIKSKKSLPFDRWFCALLYAKIHSSNGIVRLYIDDKLELELNDVDTLMSGELNWARAGISLPDNNPTVQFNFDQVVISRSPITCKD